MLRTYECRKTLPLKACTCFVCACVYCVCVKVKGEGIYTTWLLKSNSMHWFKWCCFWSPHRHWQIMANLAVRFYSFIACIKWYDAHLYVPHDMMHTCMCHSSVHVYLLIWHASNLLQLLLAIPLPEWPPSFLSYSIANHTQWARSSKTVCALCVWEWSIW